MGDFDEYEYLERAVEGGTNGKARDREEDDDNPERERARRSRSREDRGRRERDADDYVRPTSRERERDRSLERDEGDRERDRGSREPRRERDYTFRGGDRDRERERDRDRDRDYRDRRPRDRDYDRRGGRDRDRRGSRQDKDEPEADPERDQRTVFAYQINLKADERDLYEFFSQAGKVRDVRLIMDRNGRRSKGVGYIEFYDAMSVPMAIALRGQPLLGTPVMVKPSEAEKNLAAQTPLPAVAAMGGLPGMPGLPGLPTGGILGMAVPSRRLHISNLHVNMNEDQLKQVVEPFGALETVQVPVDDATGQCKGFGFVTYSKLEDSRIAQQYLNDMEVAGLKIKVQFVPESMNLPDTGAHVNPGELDDDEGGGLSLNAQSRVMLMQKLAGGGVGGYPCCPCCPWRPGSSRRWEPSGTRNSGWPTGRACGPWSPPWDCHLSDGEHRHAQRIPAAEEHVYVRRGGMVEAAHAQAIACAGQGMIAPHGYKVDDEFEQDIMEDVEAECSKFGAVVKVHVDRKNTGGQVYVKFKEIEGASKARQALHNRWFAGKPIGATFMDAAEFEAKVA